MTYGNINYDVPKRIVNGYTDGNGQYMVEIEWNVRYDKIKPKNSPYPVLILKKRYTDLIIQFFENKYI